MRCTFREDEQDVVLVISDYPSEYKSAFEGSYFTLDGGNYVKGWPKDSVNLSSMRAKYERHAEDMFAQMGHLKKVPWEKALLEFVGKLSGTDIEWWLTGSCALCARGIPIEPHDIDIMLCSKDIGRINELFEDHFVEPIRSSKGWVVSFFGVLFLHARIDLAFDPEDWVDNPDPADFGPYAMRNLEEISWKGNTLRVPPLDLQLQVNKRRGRDDRVMAIERFKAEQHAG